MLALVHNDTNDADDADEYKTTESKFPSYCVVLVLDSWNYYSWEKGPTAQHIHKIIQSSLQQYI